MCVIILARLPATGGQLSEAYEAVVVLLQEAAMEEVCQGQEAARCRRLPGVGGCQV